MKKELFSERLYRLRLERGLSRKQLADAIGVTASCIEKWEYGKSEPTLFNVVCLADTLGVTLNYLATGRGEVIER